MQQIPRVVIAGLRGGSGKTTLSIGLISALSARGLKAAPFKKGPDYIDAGWLGAAAGKDCYNLDHHLFGSNPDPVIRQSFITHSLDSDISVIEGNRGLFDGMDADGAYSTSNLARSLKTPVILIIDATKRTRTNAAVVLGAKKLERGLNLAGVVLNKIGGKRHERVSREAIEKLTGVPVLGAIPRLEDAELPERHMGLTPWQEHGAVDEVIAQAGRLIEKYVDVGAILKIARKAPALKGLLKVKVKTLDEDRACSPPSVRVGVLRDSAFQFYYPDNFNELRRLGAEVVEVSALSEDALPDIDALYIGGGFPETHVAELGQNKAFMKSLRAKVKKGLPVYAECGGLMYLGRSIEMAGKKHRMSAVLPLDFRMHKKPHAHGYTEVRVSGKNPFYKTRTILRGHEFHYSEVLNADELVSNDKLSFAFRVKRGGAIVKKLEGISYKNVLATYHHTHALGTPEWAVGMFAAATNYRASNKR